jgi:hypothetical protein
LGRGRLRIPEHIVQEPPTGEAGLASIVGHDQQSTIDQTLIGPVAIP